MCKPISNMGLALYSVAAQRKFKVTKPAAAVQVTCLWAPRRHCPPDDSSNNPIAPCDMKHSLQGLLALHARDDFKTVKINSNLRTWLLHDFQRGPRSGARLRPACRDSVSAPCHESFVTWLHGFGAHRVGFQLHRCQLIGNTMCQFQKV